MSKRLVHSLVMYRYSKSQRLDFIIPAVILAALAFLFHETSLDESIAGNFFSPTAGWIYRDNFLLEKIFHKGGVLLCIASLVVLTGKLLFNLNNPRKKLQTDYLAFVITSTLLTIIVIAIFKRFTTLPCPWNSAAFGGPDSVPPLWKMFSSDYSRGQCFPAGHSSGGFSFLSMYFSYVLVYRKRNFYMLIPGTVAGLVFGMTQEMRGAHFISHDFATIFVSICICWVTYLIYSIYNKRHET